MVWKRKLGILLILLAVCLCGFMGYQSFVSAPEQALEQRSQEAAQQKEEYEREEIDPENYIGTEEEMEDEDAGGEPEDAKEGVPDPSTYSQEVTVQITGMMEQVQALIKNPEAFEAAVKQYVYDHSLDVVEVTCRNIVTTYYSQGKQEFMMEIESEGLVFYVMQDLEMENEQYQAEDAQ